MRAAGLSKNAPHLERVRDAARAAGVDVRAEATKDRAGIKIEEGQEGQEGEEQGQEKGEEEAQEVAPCEVERRRQRQGQWWCHWWRLLVDRAQIL